MLHKVVDLTKQIKAANDIVDVIGSYLAVIKGPGDKFKCLCPFHNDTNPSLTIDRHRQRYKCWACGAIGDVITFVEKIEHVNFLEARNRLAQRAGIRINDNSRQDDHKSRLLDVMTWAQSLYHNEYINGETAERARYYIGTRHLSGATARRFGLGYAPAEYGWLERAARQDGIALDLLIEVGLLGRRDDGQGVWDRFRDRVMFPIRDVQGRTVGFGGRILPDSPLNAGRPGPKYYNTSDTVLFTKSDNIFGIDQARSAAGAAGFLAVVEGYTDVMMAHQCGITNVVATMGTALNERHIRQLRRFVPKVVLVFDADEGGQGGVDRALELFVASDLELAVATLPAGLDPADLLAQEGGSAAFNQALTNAVDALDFKLDQLMAREPRTVEGIRRMLDAVLGIMALAPPVPASGSQIKRDLMLSLLSRRLGLDIGTIKARLRDLQDQRKRQESPRTEPIIVDTQATPPAAAQTVNGPVAVLERQLIQVLLAEPDLLAQAIQQINPQQILHTGIRRLVTEIFALYENGLPADLDGLRLRLLDRPDLAHAAFNLWEVGCGIPDRPQYFSKIIDGFEALRTRAERQAVTEQLRAIQHDDEKALDLLRRLHPTTRGDSTR